MEDLVLIRMLLAAVPFVLAACEIDRVSGTRFAIGDTPSSFSFEARSNNVFPVDTTKGEAYRMAQLEKWLSYNSMCDAGFEVVSRSVVHAAGAVYIISYRGRCAV